VSTSNYDGNPIVYLAAFKEKLEPLRTQEELTLLKPDLADLYAADRAAFAVAANLIKEKLGVGRRDLEASIKPLVNTEEGADSKPLPIARFSELVDLAEDEGEVKFLIHSGSNGSGLRVETEWDIEKQLYLPPQRVLSPGCCHVRRKY
jgi:hypothetical protein